MVCFGCRVFGVAFVVSDFKCGFCDFDFGCGPYGLGFVALRVGVG